MTSDNFIASQFCATDADDADNIVIWRSMHYKTTNQSPSTK